MYPDYCNIALKYSIIANTIALLGALNLLGTGLLTERAGKAWHSLTAKSFNVPE
jgi:hypothetical protein